MMSFLLDLNTIQSKSKIRNYTLGNYIEKPRQGVGSFAVAASVVSAASNLAGKSNKKRRAPPPPSANPKGSVNGSQQSLNSIAGNIDVRKSGPNVPNTLERFVQYYIVNKNCSKYTSSIKSISFSFDYIS